MIEEVEAIGKVDKSGLSEVCCLYGLGLDGLVLDGAEGIPVGMLTGLELWFACLGIQWGSWVNRVPSGSCLSETLEDLLSPKKI